MNLQFMRCANKRERTICYLKKQIDFSASVMLLTINFVITLPKWSADPLGYPLEEQHFDDVMTKFLTNNRTDE